MVAEPGGWQAGGGGRTQTVTISTVALQDFEIEANETFDLFFTQDNIDDSLDIPLTVPDDRTTVSILDDDPLVVTGVAVSTSPSGGYYGVGDTIEFTVTFGAEVTVEGGPQFEFQLGGGTRQASGQDSEEDMEATFEYTVAAGDGDDNDGISWGANALRLNGGSIAIHAKGEVIPRNANLDHAAQVALSGHKVDTTKPSLVSAAAGGTTLTLTFSEQLNDTATAPAASAFTVMVGGGSGINPTGVSVSGRAVALTLGTGVTTGQTVTVSYAPPPTNKIRDLSGKEADAFDDAVVRTGPNQPPAFPSPTQTLTVDENATSGNLGLTPATDPQNDELAYSVSGRDEAAFREDFTLQPVTAALRVKPDATIDYESRRSYLVTITVHDGKNTDHNPDTGIDARLTLTIDVNNLDDAGTVDLSSQRPEVGVATRATLTDPDGNVRGTSWQWYRGASRNGSFTPIENATGRSYTPVQADARQYLRVRATYTDGHGAAKEAEAVTRNATIPVSTNQAASFRSEHITFNVPENTSSGHLVGDVSVTDPNGDQLYYGLHHASHLDYQADYFERTYDLGYDNGRITVKQGVVLDYEHESPLTVTIKLTDELDPFGEYDYLWDDTVTLTIKVTNLDEPGTLDLEHVRSTTGAPTEVDVSFARLSDPDGVNRIVSWEWFRGDTQNGPFTEIDSGPFSDGTESGFRPEESDIGKYLKVRVTYADVFSDSSGRMKAIEQTMGPVERWISPHPDYAFWPGRWHDAGDLAVGGTQSGVIQGGFDANGRYVNDVIDYFELTGMTAGTTYQLNLREPGAGGGHIVGFYTTDGAGLYFESRGDMQNDGYGSAQLRQALFTPSSSGGRHFVSIRGVFATQDINYTVTLVAPAADDIPDSVSTTAEGATFGSGVIEKLYDVDWHRTNNLSSSTQYLVYLKGAAANGLFDPYIVGVYDPQGNLIAGTSDNRRGIGRDASVLFTPPSYGRYYIAVSSAPEPFRPRTTRDSTGKGHTGAYVLTVTNPSGDASNYRGSTTQRMGPSGGIATVNQEYTFDYALEHNYDEEYVRIAVKPDHVYEIYIKETNPWDTAPSIRARLDTSYDIYSGPSHGCWNPYSSHAVFKSLEFSETTRDYFVRVKVGDAGGVSGKIAIRLLDTSGANLSNYESRCD